MQAAPQPYEPRLCQECGEDITKHAKYKRWTQCSYCYWKERLVLERPLNELLARRQELKTRIKELEVRSRQLYPERNDLERRLHSLRINRPLWKKLLCAPPQDSRLDSLRHSVKEAHDELRTLEDEHRQLKSSIQTARHVRKRYDLASRCHVDEQRRKTEAKKKKEEVALDSLEGSYDLDFERSAFRIRNKDYKRGNPLDNHLRNGIADAIISAFGGCCLHCSGTYDLTLDHFAIPKNEGGNFVLYLQDDESIKLNVVVLCRSCNSAKGERAFKSFFTREELTKAMGFQRHLLEWILNDATTMTIIRKWYRK
ncbi:hypothetical protein N8597_00040 [Akkermansiaceae bacterium]|nr:hypothetical protein [Akkermansiaceae bacterium]MDA7519825.1 hypothetical protein [bacterium]MDA7518684.1 hypothetical protein [Akkermansiaceae bacterium]MDA7611645.1 hypothetical protein [bacterium]MDA7650947.1 hypothetical protein [Akkermansiaceae bacterium]